MNVEQRVEQAWEEYVRLVSTGEAHWDTLTCWQTCRWLRDTFFPEGKNVGYWHDDNPTAEVGEGEGGHNILLVPEGDHVYLVDFWYDDVYAGGSGKYPHCLRMDDPKVRELYGDPDCWTYYLYFSEAEISVGQ